MTMGGIDRRSVVAFVGVERTSVVNLISSEPQLNTRGGGGRGRESAVRAITIKQQSFFFVGLSRQSSPAGRTKLSPQGMEK